MNRGIEMWKLLTAVLVTVIVGVVVLGVTAIIVDAGDKASLEDEPPVAGVSGVTVDDNKFSPRVIEVAPGTEVTWTFRDDTEHDVRAANFGSERMKKGTFTHTFADAGTYDYRCSLHSNMTGRVVVR
jgi:plastocyanin